MKDLLEKLPDQIPHELLIFSKDQRHFHEDLKKHSKFDSPQNWYVGRKTSYTSARCSGCMEEGAIKCGDIHLYVKGLLFLDKSSEVVETTLRFFPKKKCVQEIHSSKHNIRPLEKNKVKKDPHLGILTTQEKKVYKMKAFYSKAVHF